MKKEEFKNQISKMTTAQIKKWNEILCELSTEVNEMEFKTKTAYKRAMNKVYNKTIKEYLRTKKLQ